jgi:REP element-mobilizing transposase RayT
MQTTENNPAKNRRIDGYSTFGKPRRLDLVFQRYDPPLYFVTFCTKNRRKIIAEEIAHRTMIQYGEAGARHGYALGRYVIMPDHVHLFVCGAGEFCLSRWVAGLKRVIAAAVAGGRGIWQRGFFDHLVRNSESYEQKWNYVRENPVRAGLVPYADDWPFQGEIVLIDRI